MNLDSVKWIRVPPFQSWVIGVRTMLSMYSWFVIFLRMEETDWGCTDWLIRSKTDTIFEIHGSTSQRWQFTFHISTAVRPLHFGKFAWTSMKAGVTFPRSNRPLNLKTNGFRRALHGHITFFTIRWVWFTPVHLSTKWSKCNIIGKSLSFGSTFGHIFWTFEKTCSWRGSRHLVKKMKNREDWVLWLVVNLHNLSVFAPLPCTVYLVYLCWEPREI